MIDDKFLDETIKQWQSASPTPLTREDAREIIQNMCDLFDLLDEIDKELKCKTTN